MLKTSVSEMSRRPRERSSEKVVVGRKKSLRWRGLEEEMTLWNQREVRCERRRVRVSRRRRICSKSSRVSKRRGWDMIVVVLGLVRMVASVVGFDLLGASIDFQWEC